MKKKEVRMIRRLILCASLMLLSVGVFAQTYGLTLEDNIANPNIMVNISKYYGGSVDYIALKKANGAWTANLVQSGSGLNLQAAFYRIGDNVAQNLDPALQNDQEDWEKQDPATQLAYEPTCMDNAGAQKFLWNPTQAGMQPGCGDPYNLFDPSQCFQPDNGGMCESFSSAITYDSQGNPQVHYIIKYAPWVTYDHVYDFYPQYTYEGSVWEDCTVTLSSGTPGAYSIHFDSAWRLSRQDYFGNVVHTTQQLYFSDRDFYGSGSLQTSYKFDSSYAGDPYHMRKCTNLPAYATGGGKWRPEFGSDWKPYTMMSNQASPPSAWVLLYTQQNSKSTAYAGKVFRSGPDSSSGVYGNVSAFTTYFYYPLSTDYWTPFHTSTYVIVGQTEAAVMAELCRVSDQTEGCLQ